MNAEIMLYIGIGAVILLLIFVLYKRHEIMQWLQRPEVIEFIKDKCRWAEQYYIGTELGRKRLVAVCRLLYNFAPASIKAYIPWSILEKYVTKIFESIAVITEDGHKKAV